jgi:hypothetical protein
MGLPDRMFRPGGTPGQRPTRPQGGRFAPPLGSGAALGSKLRPSVIPAKAGTPRHCPEALAFAGMTEANAAPSGQEYAFAMVRT